MNAQRLVSLARFLFIFLCAIPWPVQLLADTLPPCTLRIQNNGDGTMNIIIQGAPATRYPLQAATDLAAGNWIILSTNLTGPDGLATFTDLEASQFAARFYRSGEGYPVPPQTRDYFAAAIAAKDNISISGGAVVDSFDSSSAQASSNGNYDPAKCRATAAVVTNSKTKSAIKVGTAHIYGRVATGPGGMATTDSSGAVGDIAWNASHTGIQPGHNSSDMNADYPDQVSPASSLLTPSPGSYNGTNYTYALGNGDYAMSALTVSGGQSLVVSGNATLHVTGNATVSGSGFIYIAPGASLQLYVGGSKATLSGGGIVNGTGLAANFSYHGLPANTSLTYSGSAAFIGTVNAPEAAFTLSGSAGMCGACIVNSFTSSGGASVHYDERLAAQPFLR